MDGFDYIHLFLFVLVVILIFVIRQEIKEKNYYEEKAHKEEELKKALEHELHYPNVDWKEYKEIEKLFNKIPSDFKNIEEFKEFENKYYEVIISFYKKKQGLRVEEDE
jgi:hypothetical protein